MERRAPPSSLRKPAGNVRARKQEPTVNRTQVEIFPGCQSPQLKQDDRFFSRAKSEVVSQGQRQDSLSTPHFPGNWEIAESGVRLDDFARRPAHRNRDKC